jgi:hypothetical protein
VQGHVRKRRTWEFIVDIGRHPVTGRRRQKSKGGFATKKDAESALHEFIHPLRRRRRRSKSRADLPR